MAAWPLNNTHRERNRENEPEALLYQGKHSIRADRQYLQASHAGHH